MAVLILVGIVTSSLLNIVVMPVLFSKYGRVSALKKVEAETAGEAATTRD